MGIFRKLFGGGGGGQKRPTPPVGQTPPPLPPLPPFVTKVGVGVHEMRLMGDAAAAGFRRFRVTVYSDMDVKDQLLDLKVAWLEAEQLVHEKIEVLVVVHEIRRGLMMHSDREAARKRVATAVMQIMRAFAGLGLRGVQVWNEWDGAHFTDAFGGYEGWGQARMVGEFVDEVSGLHHDLMGMATLVAGAPANGEVLVEMARRRVSVDEVALHVYGDVLVEAWGGKLGRWVADWDATGRMEEVLVTETGVDSESDTRTRGQLAAALEWNEKARLVKEVWLYQWDSGDGYDLRHKHLTLNMLRERGSMGTPG